jgi:hypothetical protein
VSSEEVFLKESEPFTDVSATELHQLYLTFCQTHHMTAKSSVHFARALAPHLERKLIQRRMLHGKNLYSKALE